MRKNFIPLLAVLLWTAGCQPTSKPESALDAAAYQLEVDAWHAKRVEALKGEDGWLNLAGLFWFKEGINTFGASEKNDIVFPSGTIDKRAGFFVLRNGLVTLEVAPGVKVERGGKPFKSGLIFHPDSTRQESMQSGNLRWFVIRRSDKTGLRLRDLQHPDLASFKGIERYPVDQAYRVTATFKKAADGYTIPITNVLGQTTELTSPGTLFFTLNGQRLSLEALEDGPDGLFLILSDLTSGKETYGAGRYLYVGRPGPDGKVVVDFNKAENPPCAFTMFATCPLPPAQNRLPIEIKAGEKKYDGHGRQP